ncbi:hypothetical protein BH10PSE18_BH10PSE18_17290 [soil metagenome]
MRRPDTLRPFAANPHAHGATDRVEATVRALDLMLFGWIGAGLHPMPWLLSPAIAIAQQGAWLSVLILAWAAWRHPAERVYLMGTLAACGVTAMLVHALAAAIDLPRPFMLGLSPAYIPHGARGSFPSAHAAVMSTVAAILRMCPVLRHVGMAAAAAAALTGWARIYVGVHFPLDMVGGVVLALAVAGLFQVARQVLRQWSAAPAPLEMRADADSIDPLTRRLP